MKKIWASLGILVLLVIAGFLIAPYFVGGAINKHIPGIIAKLNKRYPMLHLQMLNVQRHWFTTDVQLSADFSPQTKLAIDVHVIHGPLVPHGHILQLAYAKTEAQYRFPMQLPVLNYTFKAKGKTIWHLHSYNSQLNILPIQIKTPMANLNVHNIQLNYAVDKKIRKAACLLQGLKLADAQSKNSLSLGEVSSYSTVPSGQQINLYDQGVAIKNLAVHAALPNKGAAQVDLKALSMQHVHANIRVLVPLVQQAVDARIAAKRYGKLVTLAKSQGNNKQLSAYLALQIKAQMQSSQAFEKIFTELFKGIAKDTRFTLNAFNVTTPFGDLHAQAGASWPTLGAKPTYADVVFKQQSNLKITTTKLHFTDPNTNMVVTIAPITLSSNATAPATGTGLLSAPSVLSKAANDASELGVTGLKITEKHKTDIAANTFNLSYHAQLAKLLMKNTPKITNFDLKLGFNDFVYKGLYNFLNQAHRFNYASNNFSQIINQLGLLAKHALAMVGRKTALSLNAQVSLPTGAFKLKGIVNVKAAPSATMPPALAILEVLNIKFDAQVPVKFINQQIASITKGIKADDKTAFENAQHRTQSAKAVVKNMLAKGYMTKKNGSYVTTLTSHDMKMFLNGHEVDGKTIKSLGEVA